jgi:hypothetical protein
MLVRHEKLAYWTFVSSACARDSLEDDEPLSGVLAVQCLPFNASARGRGSRLQWLSLCVPPGTASKVVLIVRSEMTQAQMASLLRLPVGTLKKLEAGTLDSPTSKKLIRATIANDFSLSTERLQRPRK